MADSDNVRPFKFNVVSEQTISQTEFEAVTGALFWVRCALDDLEQRLREMRFGRGGGFGESRIGGWFGLMIIRVMVPHDRIEGTD
jgi:hypothetical protein